MHTKHAEPFRLSEQSRLRIARSVGLSFDDISQLSSDEIDRHIEKRIGKPIVVSSTVGEPRTNGSEKLYAFLHKFFDIGKSGKLRRV
ncbi:MAG: hypothetical protein LUD52_05745 [Opitutae bacterium]|nr:hypothetical protein [Opitutae bacterium]